MKSAPTSAALPQSKAWHSQPSETVLAELGSRTEGLSAHEAEQRFDIDGPNELHAVRTISPLQIFLAQFKSLIIWVLIAAGVLSGIIGDTLDCVAILAIVLLNAVIGFYQEYKAEESIAALKRLTTPHAKLIRAGKVLEIPAAGVVKGDVLVLEAGDLVAADARLLSASALRCIEASLTGEAEAVSKHPQALPLEDIPLGSRSNMVYRGTSVAAGSGRAVVVATGMSTELGRIATLIEEAGARQQTPLQTKLDSFGRVLVWATLGIVALLFVLGLLRKTAPLELFMTTVSLAVAAVPEGLPTVVTVALALGVLRMSRRQALVRRLPAIETLGSTTVICTDKTGTLTVGEMTARALWVADRAYEVTGEGYGPEGEIRLEGRAAMPAHAQDLLELAGVMAGCNNANLTLEDGRWKTIGDPTEGALLAAALKAGAGREKIENELPRECDLPFDSDRKRSSVVRRMPDGRLKAFVNGAPGEILQLCTQLYSSGAIRPLTPGDRERILSQTSAFAHQGLRVLASAHRLLPASNDSSGMNPEDIERDLVFIGLTGMQDPPRPEAMAAVAKCHTAGIRVVMITGDHPDTALAIARSLGIASAGDTAITGAELDKMSDHELDQRAQTAPVYARVTAEHKLRIVRAWKRSGAVVAMTGDGVNDAPAIKGADIGIAMGKSGTEVTRQASDMIITDDNFASIVAAVEEGRGIYDNIRKTLQYLLAGNTGELLLMAVCLIGGFPAPLLPIHLLWINLVTDGLPALCLATDPIDSDVMSRRPRRPSESIVDRSFLGALCLTGVLTAGVSFATYVLMLQKGSLEAARTSAFAVLVFAELLRSFGARSETKPLWRIPFFSNLHLVLVVTLSLLLQVWIQHNGTLGRILRTSFLPLLDVVWLIVLGSIPLLVLELVKVVRARR